MKCLCVGGMCAGDYIAIPDEWPVDDIWRVPYYPDITLENMGVSETLDSETLDSVTGYDQLYRKTKLCIDGFYFVFLRNADMSADEAIERVVTVVNELTNIRLPLVWQDWELETFNRAFYLYSQVGDPYAPD